MEQNYLSNKAKDVTKIIIIALPGLAGLVNGEQVYASQNNTYLSPNYRPLKEESAPVPKDQDNFQYNSFAILPERIKLPVKGSEQRYQNKTK